MRRSKNAWQWGASGKHPVGKDYFRVGPEAPFLNAFSDWVENGYGKLNAERGSSRVYNSWRFWAKGAKKGCLLCGVGRDSSDSIGRPYPFLILGEGPLKGWENHWDLLPFAFEKIWAQMEYLATGRFVDFRQMEDEVRGIGSPNPGWTDFESQRAQVPEQEPAFEEQYRWYCGQIESLKEKQEIFIPLKTGEPGAYPDSVNLLHFLLKKIHRGAVPNSVFMGGGPDRISLAVFMRPLVPADFVRLWSVSTEGN